METAESPLTLKMISKVYRQVLPDFSVTDTNGKQLHDEQFVALSTLSDKVLNRTVVSMSVQSCYGMPAIFVTVK